MIDGSAAGRGVHLDPGFYEMHADVPPDHFVERIGSQWFRRPSRRPALHPDWFEHQVDGRSARDWLSVQLARGAATVQGRVVHESKPVGGIPVFLYPADERTRRSANGPRITQTDAEGRYRLESLPRGVYRLLASFDLSEVSEELLESARAPSVTLKVSETATHDLSPFSAP